MFHALVFILALREFSFVQTSSVWLRLLQYGITFKQTNAYAHSQARARWRAQSLNITILQLLHYCRLRQCYSVPFRLVIYTSFSSDFDGFSYLPKHSVTVVNPSYIHHIVWDYPVMAIVRMSSQHRLRNGPIHTIQMFLSSRESTSCCFSDVLLPTRLTLDFISHATRSRSRAPEWQTGSNDSIKCQVCVERPEVRESWTENRSWPEVAILGADKKERGPSGRECRRPEMLQIAHKSSCQV